MVADGAPQQGMDEDTATPGLMVESRLSKRPLRAVSVELVHPLRISG
jgi:hypothetical protein